MATGRPKASRRIFESRKSLAGHPDSALAWEYVPIRENKYLSTAAALAIWPLAVGPPVFGGIAVGVCSRRRRGNDAADQAVGALADPAFDRQERAGLEVIWRTRRKSRRAAPRRCSQDHRWRHLRGAGASVARPRPDDAGSPARHRCAGTESGLSAGIADGRGGDRAPCATCSPRARSRSTTSGRTNIRDASLPTPPPNARTMCRPRWSRPVTGAATAAAIVAAGARPPVADSQNEKAAHAARLSNSNPVRAAQCVTVTVVPMETR